MGIAPILGFGMPTQRGSATYAGNAPSIGGPPASYDHYMATAANGGSDSNPGTQAQPWATFAHAFANMSGGQSLFVGAGTYNQTIDTGSMANGSNFSTGTTKIVGNGIGSTIINPATGDGIYGVDVAKTNIEFQHMTIEAPNGYGVRFYDVNGLRVKNLKIRRCAYQNFQIHINTTGSSNIEIMDVESTEAGVPNGVGDCHGTTPQGGYCHGFYIADADNLVMDRCISHDNNGGGAQFYPNPVGSVCKNSIFYGNRSQQVGGDPPSGVYVGGNGTKLLNCTVYDNENVGIWAIGSNAVIRNNIAYANATNYLNSGTGTTADHNSTDGTNPQFQNEGGYDFHLTASTPSGIKTGGADLSGDGVTTDYDSVARTVSYSIGAYERDS
jgi:hypothetical protein